MQATEQQLKPIKKELRRSFGGKTENFTSPQERHFEDKHLRAYLKGWKRFQMGLDPGVLAPTPLYFPVKEIWS
jgi:hypothetical protein